MKLLTNVFFFVHFDLVIFDTSTSNMLSTTFKIVIYTFHVIYWLDTNLNSGVT